MIGTQRPRVFSFDPMTLLASATLMLIFGCGSPTPTSTNTGSVQGRVLLDDVPLAGARVTFIPIVPINSSPTDITPMSYGLTDEEGKYTLRQADGTEGVALGQHTVMISKPISEDGDRDADLFGLEPVTDAVPEFYRQHGYLKRHVMPMKGSQQMDFKLSTIDPLLKEDP